MSDFTGVEYQTLSEFRYRIRLFLHFSDEQARRHAIEPQQHQLLLAIRGLPPGRKATVSEIASRMLLRHHSTVELIDRLAERRLVKRSRSSHDQRIVTVSLTRTGSALLGTLTDAHRTELESLGPKLVKALRSIKRWGRRPETAA